MPRPDLCARANVRAYPTWTVGDERFEGVVSLDRLADASKFQGRRP